MHELTCQRAALEPPAPQMTQLTLVSQGREDQALTRGRPRPYPWPMPLMTPTRARRILLTAVPAALALGLAAGPASAATTWTVSPGGPVTGHAGPTQLKDTTTKEAAINCASSSARGTLRSGSGLPGTGLGSLTAVSFSGGCYTLTAGHLPWHVNAGSYSAGTGATTGTITGIHLAFTDPGFCDFAADGTSATAGDGTVHFEYSNRTSKLRILPTGSNLHIYHVNGCGGVFHDGNAAALSGTYVITPPQAITSP
jgi:hypothetical protein